MSWGIGRIELDGVYCSDRGFSWHFGSLGLMSAGAALDRSAVEARIPKHIWNDFDWASSVTIEDARILQRGFAVSHVLKVCALP